MPHIHTEPGQHDMTVSAYIVRQREDGEWLCLVHMHKKVQTLMQIGGHIELNETPWQAIAHEVQEESGYSLDELRLLQYTKDFVKDDMNITHPVPFSVNTHLVRLSEAQGGYDHFHSDLCYGFLAKGLPSAEVNGDESNDFRWLTLAELQSAAKKGEALADVANLYAFLLLNVKTMYVIDVKTFSLEEPTMAGFQYLR